MNIASSFLNFYAESLKLVEIQDEHKHINIIIEFSVIALWLKPLRCEPKDAPDWFVYYDSLVWSSSMHWLIANQCHWTVILIDNFFDDLNHWFDVPFLECITTYHKLMKKINMISICVFKHGYIHTHWMIWFWKALLIFRITKFRELPEGKRWWRCCQATFDWTIQVANW